MSGLGIDKARGGWVVVEITDGGFKNCSFIESLVDLAPTDSTTPVAVDMPMAFPAEGRRPAEVEARALLGRRASTVFFTPPRAAVEGDWQEARQNGVSKQMWNLIPAILEVERYRGSGWIEVHPEVVFATLAGAPLLPKKSWSGLTTRRSILAAQGLVLPDELGLAGRAGPDDILDAAACALVAFRHPGGTRPLGEAHEAIWTLETGPNRSVDDQ